MPSSPRHLLTAALDKLDHYKADTRSLQATVSLLHAQLSDALKKVSSTHQQLAVSQLHLEHAQQALATSNSDLRQAKLDASASQQEAEHLRAQLHHLREQINVRDAREQARQQGYDQGLQQARQQGYDQGLQQARIQTPPDIQPSPQLSKASFDSALSLARQDTQLRFQREFEHQLSAERQRLQLLTLQHQHDFERAYRDQSDQFHKLIQDSQKHTNDIQSSLKDELKKEQQAVELMRHERDQERHKRQAEEAALELITQERDQERLKRQAEETARQKERDYERQRSASEQAALAQEKDRLASEQAALAQERDRLASKQAALAQEKDRLLAQTRPSSTASNDYELFSNLSTAPLPYIPMPRPPIDMPVPPLVMPEPPSHYTQPPPLPQTLPARQGGSRTRRSSIESQSSTSTVAGAFDSLVSFPHAVPSIVHSSGRASSSGSTTRGGRKEGPYGNPERDKDMLSDIPEDASDRSALSPSAQILVPPPPVLNWSAEERGPVIPIIKVDVVRDNWTKDHGPPGVTLPTRPDNASLLSNSSYEIIVEPPSTPTSPREGPDLHPESSVQPVVSDQYLSPAHATRPIPPIQAPSHSQHSHVDQNPLPPGFIPQTFTPRAAPAVDEEDLPPGFVPQSITDTTTGVTTPFMSNAVITSHGDDLGSRPNLVLYGNPNTGRGDDNDDDDHGTTKWASTGWDQSHPSSSTGPPVIPSWNRDDDLNHAQSRYTGRQSTPRSRTKSIYGTPSTLGESSQLPDRSQGGGDVYQNPLRQAEREGEGEGEGGRERNWDLDVDSDTDDLVARNTRINATAPLPKKKKRGGR